jgi:hypothetical protein
MPEKNAAFGRRIMVLALAAVLAVLFVTSFWYRMEQARASGTAIRSSATTISVQRFM